MEGRLPNTPQFITSIVNQLSKFHPPPGGTAPPDQNNNDTQYQPHSLPSAGTNSNNPLTQLPARILFKVKPLLLTLHCLFPNELLLALDILDRKGIKRYDVYHREQHRSSLSPLPPAAEERPQYRGENIDLGIYFVHSSPNADTDPNSNHPPQTHLVCLNAWHCSCPAFALAAFQHLGSPETATAEEESSGPGEEDEGRSRCKGEESNPLSAPLPRYTYNDDDLHRGNNSSSAPTSTSTSTSTSTPTTPFPFGGTLTRDSMKNSHHKTPVCKHLLACVLGSLCPALFGGGVETVVVDERDGKGEGQGEVEMAGRVALT
ncbi:conserved hypothetical protein [Histoplasma capsulatum var. duboisii H88]|uniref:SWIM-type domain-containing protein n=2 Tax=Ajellomyces capsulatus TaxID=5037 RepID=F0UMK3_AJEC8|nr:conserved hypothetical protein [Histoplasma capsulatum H143]EGC48143.1 conserved hypothetical protein [Histoplasma capsulatum var. duboisii H88]QSS54293.1 hypothetical protein I7I53_01796 [Histoplasma capsulatum var. duboisii H88]